MAKKKVGPIRYAVVGGLVGFVVGIFAGKGITMPSQAAAGRAPQAPAQQQQGQTPAMPEDHPSAALIQALQRMQEMAQQNPEDASIRARLGNAYYDMRQFDLAIRWYEEALALDAGNINVSTDLGTAYHYTDQSSRALSQFARSLEIDPTHPQTLHNLGVVHYSMGNLQEAVQAWELLIEKNPDYRSIEQIREQIDRAKQQMEAGES